MTQHQPNFVVGTSRSEYVPIGRIPAIHASRDATLPMITVGDLSVTRGDFDASTNRRARALVQKGVTQGDFVTIGLPNSLEFYETAFAVWKLGAIPNPVPSKLPDRELHAIVDLVRPKVVVGVDPARLGGHQVMKAGLPLDSSLSAEALPERIAPYWKAMVSGGSTGRPKIIVDHNPGVWDPQVPALRQQVDDTLLNPGPLYHNAPFSLMCVGLFTGGHVIEMQKFDPLCALKLIERHRVSWVNFVPTMLHRIWRLGKEELARHDLTSLRVVYHMASHCPAWLKQEWLRWLGPERIWELYGGTERQGSCEIGGPDWLTHPGSVGRATPGCRIQIFNESGHECPPHEVGEIYLLPDSGMGSTYHYIGAAAKSNGAWESLGDLGYLDEEGFLYLVDRRTDRIISGGVHVYPAEVEGAIDSHPDVQSSIVIGLPDDDLGNRVHAIVQLNNARRVNIDVAELRAYLSERLARQKIPRSFEFVTEPLRDDAGKARRSALRDERILQSRAAADSGL